MKRLMTCVALGLSLALPNLSEAQHGGGGHGGGGGGGYHGGGGGYRGGGGYHGGGGYGRGGYGRGGYGYGYGYGYGFGYGIYGGGLGYYDGLNPYFYRPGYYDYSVPPPDVVYGAPAATVAQSAAAVWYYCPVAKAYYPYVNVCPSGWQTVPVPAQNPQP